ncbi:hypothetical protein CL655_03100 [bacterium]|nr:hypothetical protein [bacterium]|tara:strand:- start:227 stop:595 length:369 start_codon:yes stop_codon:yes gene_type:complete
MESTPNRRTEEAIKNERTIENIVINVLTVISEAENDTVESLAVNPYRCVADQLESLTKNNRQDPFQAQVINLLAVAYRKVGDQNELSIEDVLVKLADVYKNNTILGEVFIRLQRNNLGVRLQ